MKSIIILVLFFVLNSQADPLDDMMKASNWYHSDRYPKYCTASFIQGMKVKERKSRMKVEVSSNQIGFSPIAFIELNYSAHKEYLPIYGQGSILDIFVKKQKTEDGYDYWVECPPKKEESKLKK